MFVPGVEAELKPQFLSSPCPIVPAACSSGALLFASVAFWIPGIALTSSVQVRQENSMPFLSIESQELDWGLNESSRSGCWFKGIRTPVLFRR